MGTVTMELSEWEEAKARTAAAYEECAVLRKRLDEAMTAQPDTRAAFVETSLKAAIDVVRFAVANLNPEFAIGWPSSALLAVAEFLKASASVDDVSFGVDLEAFTREVEHAAKLDRRRRASDQ